MQKVFGCAPISILYAAYLAEVPLPPFRLDCPVSEIFPPDFDPVPPTLSSNTCNTDLFGTLSCVSYYDFSSESPTITAFVEAKKSCADTNTPRATMPVGDQVMVRSRPPSVTHVCLPTARSFRPFIDAQ